VYSKEFFPEANVGFVVNEKKRRQEEAAEENGEGTEPRTPRWGHACPKQGFVSGHGVKHCF
jgi:hypothetical protein